MALSDQPLLVAIGTAVIILVSTLFFFFREKSTSKPPMDDDWSSMFNENKVADADGDGDADGDKSKQSEPTKTDCPSSESSDTAELKNVFDVKQNAPKIDEPSSTKKDESKPFKSSYYYAHNDSKTIGGYKDGLKAEDYVMNGPKLLKKTTATPKEASDVTTSAKTDNATTVTNKVKNGSTPINRYLWDDDENSKGIAKILIDTLPSSGTSSTPTTMRWQESGISSREDVKSKLVGDSQSGLIIQIRRKINDGTDSDSDYERYHLYVPRMFGEVKEVKLVVKAKKLIVKLYKKEGKDNLKAWPQLPSKVVKPISPTETNYIEDDLFHNEN